MVSNISLIERLVSLKKLFEYVTESDLSSLRQHCLDDGDVVGALIGLLYDAEVDDPEELLEQCGILEGDDV